MGNSGIILPSDLGKIIKDRTALWQTLDGATHLFAEMEKNAGQMMPSQAATIPSQLTDKNTPNDEITAAARDFQAEVSAISRSQEQIKAHQAEIQRIQNQRMITMIVVGVIALIVLCAVGYGAITLINSIIGG